jgi:hypothetical protein
LLFALPSFRCERPQPPKQERNAKDGSDKFTVSTGLTEVGAGLARDQTNNEKADTMAALKKVELFYDVISPYSWFAFEVSEGPKCEFQPLKDSLSASAVLLPSRLVRSRLNIAGQIITRYAKVWPIDLRLRPVALGGIMKLAGNLEVYGQTRGRERRRFPNRKQRTNTEDHTQATSHPVWCHPRART